ncbi:pentatricopeptide repeat-containing protein [Tanacetum coccineum]
MGISNLTLKSFLILFAVFVNSSDLRLASGVLGRMIDTRYPVSDIMDEIEVFCAENEGLRLKFRALLYGMVVDCYRNKGLLDEGVCVLLGVKCRNDFPDLSCVNVLVTSLVRCRKKDLVFKVFEKMGELKIVPDVYMYTNLIGGLCKDGDVSGAKRVFVEMGENGCDPSLVTYNVLIGGLCKNGLIDEAFEVKRSMMEKGLVPDRYTYTIALIDGFMKQGCVDEALKLKDEMFGNGVRLNVVTYSSLISGLCKARRFEEAIEVLTGMKEKGTSPDAYCYNSLIIGLCNDKRMEVLGFDNQLTNYHYEYAADMDIVWFM